MSNFEILKFVFRLIKNLLKRFRKYICFIESLDMSNIKLINKRDTKKVRYNSFTINILFGFFNSQIY